MELYNLMKGIIFFIVAIIGTVGNLVVLALFLHIAYQHKLTAAERLLLNLAWSNSIMLLTRGVPHSLFVFGLRDLFSDIGCKIVVYLSRVSRAMSICLTCFLSCLQCITIATSTLKWVYYIKVKMQKYVIPITVFVCLLNMIICIGSVIFSISGTNSNYTQFAFNLGYCIVNFPDKLTLHFNGFAPFARDIVFVVAMALASAYILLILYRHGKKVKGIRNSEHSHESTAEGQATKTVVTLVTLYIIFFGIDNTIFVYQIAVSKEVHTIVSDIRFFLSICYGLVFPFIIIGFNSKIRTKLKPSSSEQQTEVQEVSSI
uniref:Vomeronasal type-1 receptor n=1 Tax=Latimeria chalumnae TaxID=7897 RepID=H2ZXC0_LATCH